MVDHAEFLHLVIEDGMTGARESYAAPRDVLKLEGSIAGFEACRGKSAEELLVLLQDAARARMDAFRDEDPRYFFWRCREAEIEWVCNVLSAARYNQGLPVIHPVSARGMNKAADILGVADTPAHFR